MQGGSLETDLVVIVYNIDTGRQFHNNISPLIIKFFFVDEEVGRVTFEASTSTSQIKPFNFNYDDNDIALESTRNIRLGIREMPQRFAVVSHSEMMLEIIDDDG